MYQVLNESYKVLEALEATVQPTWESLMLPLERLEDPMDRVWGFIQHLSSVMNSDALIAAIAEVCQTSFQVLNAAWIVIDVTPQWQAARQC